MTNITVPATPSELLKKFQPRFRQIELVPKGFGMGRQVHQNHFIFILKHMGTKDEIHPNYYRDGSSRAVVLFDVQEGKCGFSFRYDPASAVTIDIQLEACAAKAILSGPLAKPFYVDVDQSSVESVLRQGEPRVRISCGDGKPIAGLFFPKEPRATHWHFFIPPGTPEFEAMNLAVDLDVKKRQIAGYQLSMDSETSVRSEAQDISEKLADALAKAA